jgi:putative restriction endonuclease
MEYFLANDLPSALGVLHRLFDEGYMTLDPHDRRVVVSASERKRIREEFDNGKDYYKLGGQLVREPSRSWARPSTENIEFHAYNVFQ